MKKINLLFFCFLAFGMLTHSVYAEGDSMWHDVQRLYLTQADSAIKLAYFRLNTLVKQGDYDNMSQGQYWLGNTFMKVNIDSAIAHNTLALQYAEKTGQPILIAKALHLRGSIDNRNSQFDDAIDNFKKALKVLEAEKDTNSKRYIQIYEILLRGTSTSYNYMNKNDEAMSYGLKALNYAQYHKLDFPEQAGLIAISSLFYKIENFEEAKRYMHLALKKCSKINNEIGASKCYANLAIYHYKEKKLDSALYYQTRAADLNRKIKSYEGLANNLVILAGINFDLNKVKEAIVNLEEAEILSKEKGFDNELLEVLVDLCLAYNKEKRYRDALAKEDELIRLSTEKKRHDKLAKAYKQKYESLCGLGNYKDATGFLEKSIAINDSLEKEANEKNLQQLLVKYETEKKEEEIKRITTEAEVKDLLIRQRNIQLGSLVAGVVVLLLLAFLVFRSYRIKKEFELLDLKQRFYRAQINPHFLFNALGSVQVFFYDKTDPNKAAGYLSRLSKLMRQILENTFDNEVTVAEEITLMENYLEIQKVRMGNRFEYEITVDDELRDVLIPSMITQPFLENTVEHGFKELNERKGKINIHISDKNSVLQIKIEDNGTGLSEKKSDDGHKSRAMDITWERLRLLGKTKKKHADFEVIDNITKGGTGVTVLINLPV